MKKMMKRIAMTMMVMMLFASKPLNAQVFILDEEFEGQERVEYDDWGLIVPYQGGDLDQYLPLGDGVLALGLLGGAYLLAKRKKKE